MLKRLVGTNLSTSGPPLTRFFTSADLTNLISGLVIFFTKISQKYFSKDSHSSLNTYNETKITPLTHKSLQVALTVEQDFENSIFFC